MVTHSYTKLLLLLDAASITDNILSTVTNHNDQMYTYVYIYSDPKNNINLDKLCKTKSTLQKLRMHMCVCVCVCGPRVVGIWRLIFFVRVRMALVPWHEHCDLTSCFAKDGCVSIYL